MLVDYVDNILPPGEADAVTLHLPGCALCSREVEILRKSLEPEAAQPANAGSESRIRERFRRFLLRQERATAHWSEPRHYLAAVLAAAVLILLYPAYLGLKQMMPRVLPADPAAYVVRLEAPTRDPSARVPVIHPDPHAEYLGLMFFVPLPELDQPNLDCRLERGGRVVHVTRNLASFDRLGNFLLLIRRNSLPAGHDYLLTVSAPGNAALTWRFPFALEPRGP